MPPLPGYWACAVVIPGCCISLMNPVTVGLNWSFSQRDPKGSESIYIWPEIRIMQSCVQLGVLDFSWRQGPKILCSTFRAKY